MKHRARLIGGAVGLLMLAAPIGMSISTAQAQTTTVPRPPLRIPPLPPTFPCDQCGPSGERDAGVVAWAYPLHFCPNPDGSAEFAIIYGWGRLQTGPATFFGSIQGIVRQLRTLQPGDETAEYPTVNVQPGERFLLTVWATTNGLAGGPRVTFGNGRQERNLILVCTCPTPQTQLITTVQDTPTTVGTTVPGSPTSTPRSPTTTAKVSLPPTGTGLIVGLAAGGVLIVYLGMLAWAHTRRLED